MKTLHLVAAGLLTALTGAALAPSPAAAQVQLNVCGAPPLPPCGPSPDGYGRRPPPPDYDRGYDRGPPRDFGRLCRTRFDRCRVEPRPIGARCSCVNDDDEEVLGRIVR